MKPEAAPREQRSREMFFALIGPHIRDAYHFVRHVPRSNACSIARSSTCASASSSRAARSSEGSPDEHGARRHHRTGSRHCPKNTRE
jgi:hypothetical protein